MNSKKPIFLTGQVKEGFHRDRKVGFTARQVETLKLLGQGVSQKRIAEIQKLSPQTTWTRVARMREKLSVYNTDQLIEEAKKQGVI